jgi:hypothetical protein
MYTPVLASLQTTATRGEKKRLTAYDVLASIDPSQAINPEQLTQLTAEFEKDFLAFHQFEERPGNHRQPVAFKNEILQELYRLAGEIQHRPDMRDIDPVRNAQGYATSVINNLWTENKRGRTLYSAISQYCSLRSKDVNTIAVHIAEYRAINRLIGRINHSMKKVKPTAMTENDDATLSKKSKEVKDRRANSKIFCYQCKGETHQKCLFEKGEITPPNRNRCLR